MKRVNLLICCLFFLILWLLTSFVYKGLSKTILPIDKTILKADSLHPETLAQIQWRKNTNYFTFVRNDTLLQRNATLSKALPLITRRELNRLLNKHHIKMVAQFPEIEWISYRKFYFIVHNYYIKCDISSKTIETIIDIPTDASHIKIWHKYPRIAYIKDNNIYIATQNKNNIQITRDTSTHIINGALPYKGAFNNVKRLKWSPDGKYLAFFRINKTNAAKLPVLRTNSTNPSVRYKKGSKVGDPISKVSIGVFHFDSKRTVLLKTGNSKTDLVTKFYWSPDSKSLFVCEMNRKQDLLQLNQYEIITGRRTRLLFSESNNKYIPPDYEMAFLRSNQNQFVWRSYKNDYSHLYIYNKNGLKIKQLTQGNWNVTDFIKSYTKDTYLFFLATKASPVERHLYRINKESGNLTRITQDTGTHNPLVSPSGAFVIDKYSNISTPQNISIIDSSGTVLQTIFSADNPLKDYDIGKVEISKFQGEDGTDFYYRLIKPSGFSKDGRYPALVHAHKGPGRQMVQNKWLGGASLWDMYMSQGGYVIFTMDNYGSANRGLEFEQRIYKKLGMIETRNQRDGVDFLYDLPYVENDRIGVFGYGFGGYMSTLLMLRYPDVYRVGVAGAPVLNWKYADAIFTERYMGTPETNPQGYDRTNLLNYTDNLRGRLLIMQGLTDKRSSWNQSLRFIEKCIQNQRLVDMFMFPNQNHTITGENNLYFMKKVTQYFEDYL